MFTGLVETTARVQSVERSGPDARIALSVPVDELCWPRFKLGASVAVSGVCLTVTREREDGFDADVSAETLSLTTLGSLVTGDEVNIERSLKLGDPMGGHIVLGHVDGVATVRAVDAVGEARRIVIRPPAALVCFIAAKGSVCLDGVSLTVNRLEAAGGGEEDDFELMLVPHTLQITILSGWATGSEVNLEVDVLARYVLRGAEVDRRDDPQARDARLMDKLARGGLI